MAVLASSHQLADVQPRLPEANTLLLGIYNSRVEVGRFQLLATKVLVSWINLVR